MPVSSLSKWNMMLCYFQIQKFPGGLISGLPLSRSDPAVFESRLEKRIEFRKQPVGHSRQGDFIKCVEQKVRPAPWLTSALEPLN